MTHYIPAFTERNGRQQRAACGAWAYSSEHSTTPDCLGCQTWLTKDAVELDAAMEALAAEPPALNPVRYEPFDPCGPLPKGKR